MTEHFDLFGNPVRTGSRGRGRPAFEVTEEKVNKVKLALALGWSIEKIANALACSTKTVMRYFSPELKERAMARDQLDLHRVEQAMAAAATGNVGAMRLLDQLIEKNDRMDASRRFQEADDTPRPTEEKMGKKEAAQKAAEDAGGSGTLWGSDLTPGYRPN